MNVETSVRSGFANATTRHVFILLLPLSLLPSAFVPLCLFWLLFSDIVVLIFILFKTRTFRSDTNYAYLKT